MKFKYTNKELEEKTDYEMLHCLVIERLKDTKTPYTPLAIRLGELDRKLSRCLHLTA